MPAAAPTMAGFEWTHRNVLPSRPPLGDLWCLRDAVCELFRWPPGSAEWSRFVEAPEPHDVGRLFQHLGLQGYDPEYRPHALELATRLDHPGIAFYRLHSIKMEHAVFEGHIRHLRGLPQEYARLNPEFFHLVVDDRQSPRPT